MTSESESNSNIHRRKLRRWQFSLRTVLAAILLAAVVFSAWRWAFPPPKIVLVPVKGTVRHPDGTPLAEGVIWFQSQSKWPHSGITSISMISNGDFQLYTFREGDGVPPGDYFVFVKSTYSAVNQRYFDYENPVLRTSVKYRGRNHFDFHLKP